LYAWRLSYDLATRGPAHRVRKGFGHALLSPAVARTFRILRVSAALWEHGQEWVPLAIEPHPFLLEVEHGAGRERELYNRRELLRAARSRKLVTATFGGLTDFFAPVVVDGRTVAVLAVGPTALSAPSSTDALQRWRELTGKQGSPSDPEFAAFLSVTLGTLVLEGAHVRALGELLGCLTTLMAGRGDAGALTNRAERLRAELEHAREAEWTWEVVRDTLDPRLQRASRGTGQLNARRDRGLSAPVDHVLVALTRSSGAELEPVEGVVRRHAFQKSAVELARKTGYALAGQVGDYGVVFVCGTTRATARRRNLVELAARAATLARRSFDLSLHFGQAEVAAGSSTYEAYRSALAAAEVALVQGRSELDFDRPAPGLATRPLRKLRGELGRALGTSPDLVRAHFDRYVEAVVAQVGHRIEAVRTQLEIGFERLLDGPLTSGVLDAQSAENLLDMLELAALNARTASDLIQAYRRAAADVCAALEHPTTAHRERSLRRAEEYLEQHYTERVRMSEVARVAGFAPTYFSALFQQKNGVSFTDRLRRLRLSRAEELLTTTTLGLDKVAELSGLGTRQYLNQVVRRERGLTPLAFRRRGAQSAKRRR
jgi:AraC-like DNA-binding protein